MMLLVSLLHLGSQTQDVDGLTAQTHVVYVLYHIDNVLNLAQ